MRKGFIFSEEHKKRLSEARGKFIENGGQPWNKGKKLHYKPGNKKGFQHKEETKKKISVALVRRKRPDILGKNQWNWKGGNVGYVALHDWVRRSLGKPSICEKCGREGLSGRQIHWANKSREYKRDLSDWLRLCVPCHKKYDRQKV